MEEIKNTKKIYEIRQLYIPFEGIVDREEELITVTENFDCDLNSQFQPFNGGWYTFYREVSEWK